MFGHGVASGDPRPDAVVLWTRVTTDRDEVPLAWVLATDPALTDVVASGTTTAAAEHDHCVHVDVDGLTAGSTYHYAFRDGDTDSPVGRTRTLPADPERVRFAVCSCAKFNAGFFNAYARIAEQPDLDFVLHLGDYIYEAGNVPAKGQTPGADIGRDFDPLDECRTLADYRRRYAQYRADPDVQAVHQVLPIIGTVDDHELADGAWRGGADAHDEDAHGPWTDRRDAAYQARWEWQPMRRPDPADPIRAYQRVTAGDLVDVFLLDIRTHRDQPALEPVMSEPQRTMLGPTQRAWLTDGLASSTTAWRVLATPSVFVRTWRDGMDDDTSRALRLLKLNDEDGTGPDEDQWDGYPAERAAVLEQLASLDGVVVLSADIHVSLASELHLADGTFVAPELTSPSLTSQNLDDKLGEALRSEAVLAAERGVRAALPHVRWCELASHGYAVVDVDAERVRYQWWHVPTVLERQPGDVLAATAEVRRDGSVSWP